ncbi:acyl-CoA dehydrogenase C-terminal domain-containing protein [Paralimibaculum aggregatum]|uniref:Acyl-CoA dehydrogenase C-terminal domain-containing protein n=1 Tax=Paralimibaculum aggregatum TaxID=3036245 RepID=A0ABQ6LP72_9RHOB|nr:acyl-CoA dehydrogenase C-terminal domain-containing protein [Limibaculum sp. NKW23]GMG84080.1 acyl-CoA dehydrogenase C-terminal domain-containing protein [Limibaculum sp. NKW23]
MYEYRPPLRDYRFVLHEVLKLQEETGIAGYAELTPDFTGSVLEEAGRIAREVLQPLNAVGDAQGCRLGEDGEVTTPEGFRAAYDMLREGGWPALECDPDYGGQGLPSVLGLAVGTLNSAANMAFMMYHGLTHSAYKALHAHGTEAQKRTYLPPLASGAWMGTMNLTEPQCGTDLGLITTRAEPGSEGAWSITGQKIWISSGEHDLAENIVHLVLARTPGAPAGTRGLSMFVVPKFLPDAEGRPGARNAVRCTGVERKMGLHGSATCAMAYDGATGWLVGEETKGLRNMFTMMNEARLLVGMQGLAVAQAASDQAVQFARERLQGRAVTGAQNPDGPADPIIVHADVRRMLLEQKAFTEGGTGFLSWVAMLNDAEHRHTDAAERERAADMVALLTPVVKGFLTDEGFRSATVAQQVLGGAGYVRDAGVEQLVRDVRIAMVYEGTTGVQALDLVGRKLGLKGGKPIMTFFDYVKGYIRDNEDDLHLAHQFLGPLKEASKDLQRAAMFFMQAGMKNPNAALAGAVDFLHLFGHVCMALVWSRMAKAASAALAEGTEDTAYYEAKLATGRFYMSRVLPATKLHLARIETGAEPVMDLPAASF